MPIYERKRSSPLDDDAMASNGEGGSILQNQQGPSSGPAYKSTETSLTSPLLESASSLSQLENGHADPEDPAQNAEANRSDVVEESHTRSLLKGISWRLVATTTTIIVSFLITNGEVATALKIGAAEFFAKLAIYYAHERIWAKIRI
uniref:DUF2061 domain-containing protein n=1 Tax=Craspedostauros australis TaxID=1486917 RepID=A0A7R9WXL7_9STRA|mmetsp:Transcript_3510/g.9336  ORF Transcript_3510/g.9336 Transcript_3510/m.9336 type:complete len:147 (+) Transcript_3510:97-537(+)|eukprot:CAMPEP_0198111192 /NCGR_PEP_ID=MMETSP1442-20131203/3176_1 /TAXON_ID= /ORGANISM="Craspedostauros australis, Strain CCMP3328" /LENGTH=146 /DNA_ID=CAMNT_0043767545 /DNA_START=38 /DNA_END=478 /DNA_ORIENTATION=-